MRSCYIHRKKEKIYRDDGKEKQKMKIMLEVFKNEMGTEKIMCCKKTLISI